MPTSGDSARRDPAQRGRSRFIAVLLFSVWFVVAGFAGSCSPPGTGPGTGSTNGGGGASSGGSPGPSTSSTGIRPPTSISSTSTTGAPDPVAGLLAEMDIRQKAAQLLVVGFEGTAVPPELAGLLREGPVGGVLLFESNVKDPEQLARLTARLQAGAAQAGTGVPLLIAVDQEGGTVRRVREGVPQAPGARTVAETMTRAEAENLALRTGEALLRLGINTNLAPVADVVADPTSFLYARSYGGDPGTVGSYVTAVIEGQERAGIVSVVKHFPGHGSAVGDSHTGAVSSQASLDELESRHLPPFRAAIRAGVPMIMVSHVIAAGLGETGPSSSSAAVIQGLLRESLGFKGVVITDDVEMVGALGGGAAALDSIAAGADLVIVGHDYGEQRAALESLMAGAEDGRIPTARLDEAVTRVLRLKQAYGVLPRTTAAE